MPNGRSANLGNLPATERQIDYALALLARHDEPLVADAFEKPTADEVRKMTRREVSALIDALKEDL
jgi:hypothetical protein